MRRLIPILATLLVLCALAADKALFRPVPSVADGYHARIRAAAAALPRHLGPWLGVDVPVPNAAVEMLKPNAIVAREYQNIETRERVTLLFIHVHDARDIIGHYPPVCYPNQGWEQASSQPSDWIFDERVVRATEYVFIRRSLEGQTGLAIDNFLILPGGETCRDMDGVEVVAQDRLWKHFGASQVQFIHHSDVPPERRRQVVEQLMELLASVVTEISKREPQ